MKRRTFLTTLTLFLVFFNLGIFIVSVAMFNDTVNREKEKSLSEHYFIVSALTKDLYAVENRGINITGPITSLLQPYSYLSGNSKMGLVLYENNQLIYSNQNTTILKVDSMNVPENGHRSVVIRKSNKRTYVMVIGRLPGDYNSYALGYLYDMTEAINAWNHLKNMLFLAGFILSLLFALGLMILLNRIFQPLQDISLTSKKIANGAYGTRLHVSGEDELSKMAQSFNHMAEEIQEQIVKLKDEADRKQQFVDNFAHEIRTPLTAIYGYAEYMEKAVLSEDDRLVALQYIMSESRRLQTIAFQLMELANLQNNPIIFEKIRVSELFDSIQQTMFTKLEERNIQLEFMKKTDLIYGDVSLLESLLINLIHNAIKACQENGHIVVCAKEKLGKRVMTVKDDGKGMPPEVLSQITEPFYREDKARRRNDGGAGLGLAICKQIATSHHAELGFVSRPGEGTEVTISFTTSQ